MRGLAVAVAVLAATAGCGDGARKAAPARCIVRIYFCTQITCGRTATKGEVAALARRLREDADVYSVRFVDKREALEIMRRRHPDMVRDLPANPFPDSLRVRPVAGVGGRAIRAKARPGAGGVETVKSPRNDACRA